MPYSSGFAISILLNKMFSTIQQEGFCSVYEASNFTAIVSYC